MNVLCTEGMRTDEKHNKHAIWKMCNLPALVQPVTTLHHSEQTAGDSDYNDRVINQEDSGQNGKTV